MRVRKEEAVYLVTKTTGDQESRGLIQCLRDGRQRSAYLAVHLNGEASARLVLFAMSELIKKAEDDDCAVGIATAEQIKRNHSHRLTPGEIMLLEHLLEGKEAKPQRTLRSVLLYSLVWRLLNEAAKSRNGHRKP